MSDTGPLFVSSGDLIADRRYKWALDQAARGDFAAAAEVLGQTVELVPGFATAWFALGAIRDRLGDRAGAVAAFAKACETDPEDYHGARLQLARLDGGDDAPGMTETYVRRLFDQYAGRYDAALTEHLAYRGPAILRAAVDMAAVDMAAVDMASRGKASRGKETPLRFGAVLDLGCGTGLGGAAFRSLADRMVGVDLSPAMIARADAKRLYDRLVTAGIANFLTAEIASGNRYQLVLAADVFVYVNDLKPVLEAVARLLTPDGLLAFTAETHAGTGIKLLPTLRFAFGEAYLRATIAAAGLIPFDISAAAVRTEKGVAVDGLVVVAGLAAPGGPAV